MSKLEGYITLGLLALIAVPSCVGCDQDYSSGKRVGTVVRFSEKGVLKKSWEGTLHLGSTRDAATGANAWDFSVTDPGVVKQVQDALDAGEPVQVLYKQWWVKPWYVDTRHILQQAKAPQKLQPTS